MNITELRSLYPITKAAVYLNNAAETPLNTRVQQRLNEYLALASRTPHKKKDVRKPVRQILSELFGGNPDHYALVTSTGVGIGIVAAGYPWQKGDNVVLPADEHWNNTFPWLSLRDRGVDIRLVPVEDDQRIDPHKVAEVVDNETRIVATTAVRFNTGFRANLKTLSRIAHDKDALFLVDGVQGAGVCPIHTDSDGIDILACAGFKWLLGMHGTGFLYMNERAQKRIAPVLPGLFAAEHLFRELKYHNDARRYETGSLAYALFHAWPAGLGLLKENGIENIHARTLSLTDRIIAGLRTKNISISSPVENVQERSAIISFSLDSEEGNKNLHKKLLEQNIIVAYRDGRIRVSPNFFNTEEEIDVFLDKL